MAVACAATAVLPVQGGAAENIGLPADPRPMLVFETDEGVNGVTLTRDGRIFIPVQRGRPDKGCNAEASCGFTLSR